MSASWKELCPNGFTDTIEFHVSIYTSLTSRQEGRLQSAHNKIARRLLYIIHEVTHTRAHKTDISFVSDLAWTGVCVWTIYKKYIKTKQHKTGRLQSKLYPTTWLFVRRALFLFIKTRYTLILLPAFPPHHRQHVEWKEWGDSEIHCSKASCRLVIWRLCMIRAVKNAVKI